MVNLLKRMRKLKSLLAIRLGQGAAILPPPSETHPQITRLLLSYPDTFGPTVHGPRLFWRNHLPRLKYHNPSLPITVSHPTTAVDSPHTLTVFFKTDPASASARTADAPMTAAAPSTSGASPRQDERAETIDVRNMKASMIWQRFQELSGAVHLKANEEEKKEAWEAREFEKRAEVDRRMVKASVDARKREAEMLRKARGEVERLKAEA